MTFNDTYSHVETFYDDLGRVVKTSEPYFDGNTKYYSTKTYDIFGREVFNVSTAGVTISNDYVKGQEIRTVSGNFSGAINGWSAAINQSITKTSNGFGELLSIDDSLTNPITYDYDAKGNLLTATGVDLAVITNTYDVLQRRLSINDPDKGLWQTSYNALGETVQTIAPDDVTTLNFYDSVGRPTSRVVKDSSAADADTIETSLGAYVGALVNIESVSSGSQTEYTYDEFGRLSSKTVSIDGYVFNTAQTYDQFGRLFQKFDASGESRGLAYGYKNGVIESVYETQGSLSQQTEEYYKLFEVDARGNGTLFRQGNGVDTVKLFDQAAGFLKSVTAGSGVNVQLLQYEFDGLGNLRARQDQNQQINSLPLNEVFEYDALNRMTQSSLNGVVDLSVTYADNGNILTKSDVSGTYTYGSPSASCSGSSAGPHALTAVGANSYCYDNRGNQTHTYSSGVVTREVQYSHFDKPLRIASPTETTDFQYDSSRNRIKRVDIKDLESTYTYYADGIEFIVDPQGVTKYKRYLDGHAIHDVSTTVNEISYVHTDHLGSMDVYTDEAGVVKERMSFGAFGERRDALGWNGTLTPGLLQAITDISKRGFTGHEHIEHSDVIHMNGRIYDPITGRFMQADPIIQEVKNSQNYNRYSYVLNNPLSYTDPTGYNFRNLGFSCSSSGITCTNATQKVKQNSGNSDTNANVQGNAGNVQKLKSSEGDSDFGVESTNVTTGVAFPMGMALPIRIPLPPSEVPPVVVPGSPGVSDIPQTSGKDISDVISDGMTKIRESFEGDTVRIFRVESDFQHERVIIKPNGDVSIINSNKMLFLNFGEHDRAVEFLNQKLQNGDVINPVIKSFEITRSFFKQIQATAVPESMARDFPNLPIRVDINKAPDQFGLRSVQNRQLKWEIIRGSGRVEK